MAAFNFPNSPSVNDLHTENGVTFKWNGTIWLRVGNSYSDISTLNVSGISTFAGITTVTAAGALFTKQLNVAGVTTFTGVVNVGNGDLKLGDSNSITWGEGVDALAYHTGSAFTFQNKVGDATLHNNAAGSNLLFKTRPSSGSAEERLRIDSSGFMGLGTNSPSSYNNKAYNFVISSSGHAGMTIAGGTSSDSSIYFADGTSGAAQYAGWVQYEHDNNALTFGANTSERLRIDSSGNIGQAVTPSAWSSAQAGDFYAYQVGTGAALFGRGSGDEDRGGISVNYYHTGSAEKYIGNGNAARIYLADGNIDFSNASANSSGANAAMTLNHRLRIDSSGRTLIGTTSSLVNSPLLQVYQSSSGSGAQILIRGDGTSYCEASVLGQVNNASRGSGWYAHDRNADNEWFWGRPYSSNDQFIIARKASPSNPGQDTAQTANSIMTVQSGGNVSIDDGNLLLASGHGIDFSATANSGGSMSSELLDDYEEGTFSPVFNGSNGGGTSRTGAGFYTKVGDIVTCFLQLNNADGSNFGGGYMKVTGLPYAATQQSWTTNIWLYRVGFDTARIPMFYIGVGDSFAYGYYSRNDDSWQPWYVSEWDATQLYCRFNLIYKA